MYKKIENGRVHCYYWPKMTGGMPSGLTRALQNDMNQQVEAFIQHSKDEETRD